MDSRVATRLSLLAGFLGLGTAHAQHVVQALPSLQFDPPDLVIDEGQTVDFQNAGGFHNVREVEAADSVAPVQSGFCAPAPDCMASASAWSTVIAFAQPGTYHYLCEVHGTAMRGRITVIASLPVEPLIFASGFEGS